MKRRARDHCGPVASHPVGSTQPNTGGKHQYLRTRDRRLFFFFLFNVGAAIISLSRGCSNGGGQILVCYNPNSSPDATARAPLPEIRPMIPAHAPAPLTATRNRRSTMKGWALLAWACCLVVVPGVPAQRKPKPTKEEITQTLQLPKELPGAVIGETRRLTFHVTPLSAPV